MELLGYMLSLCLIFKELAKLFKNGCTILYSHQQCMRFQFFHILTDACYFLVNSHLSGYKVIALSGFNLHLPTD